MKDRWTIHVGAIEAGEPAHFKPIMAVCHKSHVDIQVMPVAEHEAAVGVYVKALNDIASWGEGETVNGTFDEPASAKSARDALASFALASQQAQEEK